MANRNRTMGNNLERQYVNEIKELGFPGLVTSRAESRGLDARKVDIFDLDDEFPFYIQVKNAVPNMNYHKMFEDDTRDRRKPYIIMHKKTEKKGSRFMKVGEYVIMDKSTFYDLISHYHRSVNN